jgi:hypothetical protein
MTPVAKRLLDAKNDARMAGKRAVKARVNDRDMKELESWVRQQNRPHMTGLPQQNLDPRHLWGMDIVVDEKVRDIFILEFEKK